MEVGGSAQLLALLQAAALEYDAAGGAVDNSVENPAGVQEGFCVSVSVLSELHDFFRVFDESSSSDIAGVWEELAERKISAAGIVRILTGTMERGGVVGLKAADVYLSLLLVPGWPVYSLFSQMAFDGLARCLRNSCKPTPQAAGGQESAGVDRGNRGQKVGKRGRKRNREKHSADDDEPDSDLAQFGSATEATELVSVEHTIGLLAKLQRAILVLNLKERQETLKLIVGLLVDMLHLLGDGKEDGSYRKEIGAREKKRSASTAPKTSAPAIIFSTLERMLEGRHGQPVTTAMMVLRAFTPTILLTHTMGDCKADRRNKTLQFVTHTLLTAEFTSVRSAVVALPRYLCFRAPEKTDGRSLAVESVITVMKALNSKEWCRYTDFLCKFSHSKPRHRLVAVDVSLALLEGLPTPLRHLRVPNNLEHDHGVEPRVPQSNVPENGRENDLPGACSRDIEDQVRTDVDLGVEREEQNTHTDNSLRNVQVSNGVSLQESQWWSVTCFEILLHRCSDKIAGIRARSLANLAQAIEILSVDVSSRRHLQILLGFYGSVSHGAAKGNVRVPNSRPFSSCDTPIIGGETPSPEPSLDLPSATPLTPGAGHRDLWSLLQRRCLDDKAAVRKATFLLMKKSTALLGKAPDDAILETMGAACGDPMISIRRAALSALSEVLRRFPGDAKVAKEWLKSALPLAFDNEQSLQDECLSLFEELVLDRITLISTLNLRGKFQGSGGHDRRKDLDSLVPVGTISTLREMADGSSISSCVKRICSSLGKKKRIRPGVALALQSLISTHDSPNGAWFLLSEVTAFVPKAVGWEFLRTHWELLENADTWSNDDEQLQEQQAETSNGDKTFGDSTTWAANRVHLLQTISNVAVELPPDAAADLAMELLDRLKAFNMHPAEVGAHIKSLAILCRRKALTTEEGDQLVIQWVKDLLEQAGNILQATMSPSLSASTDNGVDAFHTPKANCGTKSLGRQTRSRSKHDDTEGNQGGKKCGRKKESPPQIVTVIFTVGALALICPQVKVGHAVTLLQTLLTPARGLLRQQRVGEAESLLLKDKITPEIIVQVRVALGKLCLADDALAKRCIPLFVQLPSLFPDWFIQELGRTDSAAVRNNTMIIMTDFCVRYTALIDGYIHDLTRALRDSCELVRRQTFVLLSRLLQRDYVKWRGTLFHRFLLALVDDSEKISQLAKFVFGSVLKLKAPLLAYNSFVEAIFVLNDCCSQASSSALLQIPESERALFSLRGGTVDVVEKRMKIYSTLLQQMLPEHLLATSAKLCAEILAAAADGLLDLNNGPSQCVLQDALRILASKELKINGSRAWAGNAEQEEEDGGTAAAMAAVKGRVVTQLMKKNLVQNAVPIFIELKRLLESKNSPLLGLLMECMRVMLKDYKNEIEEILVADKQLQKEILYDMQKHEAAKARAKVAAAAAAIPIQKEVLPPGTPGASRTPVPAQARFEAHKDIRDSDEQQARRTAAGKGIVNPSPTMSSNSGLTFPGTLKSAYQHPEIANRTPAFSSLKKSTVGTYLYGDGRAGPSTRVTWLDRTPRTRICSAIPASLSRLQSSDSHHTPRAPHPHTSYFRQTPMGPPRSVEPSYPVGDSQDETCLAGAVADVVAATTVATVLQQVAEKSVTPLGSMSLPRLRSSVSTANSALRGQQSLNSSCTPVLQDERTPVESLAGGNSGLETVRRRQSFSSV